MAKKQIPKNVGCSIPSTLARVPADTCNYFPQITPTTLYYYPGDRGIYNASGEKIGTAELIEGKIKITPLREK